MNTRQRFFLLIFLLGIATFFVPKELSNYVLSTTMVVVGGMGFILPSKEETIER